MTAQAGMQTQAKAVPKMPVSPVRGNILQRKCACGGNPGPTGECEQCRKKRMALQRKAANGNEVSTVPPIVHDMLRSPGQPLDAGTLAFMEPRFGHDFSNVRVHHDARAAESAQAVNALAYTVGRDVVFGNGQYAPTTSEGRKLMAHELTHVVQQSLTSTRAQTTTVVPENHPSEIEAGNVVQHISTNTPIVVTHPVTQISRHKDDLVAYTGGQSGKLVVIGAARVTYTAPSVSGHPGHGENEPSEGPIPTGSYILHPQIKRAAVTKLQDGVCGASGINSGYQEINSNHTSPCSGTHYCNVSCPTPSQPNQKCFTPQDCWGPYRIKIEGSREVVTPFGKQATRDGFYIHGGNPNDAISSGCIKSLDNSVFSHIKSLTGIKGSVPLCVGRTCERALGNAIASSVISNIGEIIKDGVGF